MAGLNKNEGIWLVSYCQIELEGCRQGDSIPGAPMSSLCAIPPKVDRPIIPVRTSDNLEWPTKASCEMNVSEWKLALQRANLLPEYNDVLKGFAEGFDQGIPSHTIGQKTKYYTPENHSSASQARLKITESIRKEIEAGRMFGPFTRQQFNQHFPFFRTSPLGAVVNGDGSLRPINNLSYPHSTTGIPSVNSFVNPDDFTTTWDDFNIVANFLRQTQEPILLALFDWEKAYRQIPTASDQWPYLMVRDFEDRIILNTMIAFGGVAGCGSFGQPADAWKKIMINKFDVITIFRWVDNNLFIKKASSTLTMEEVVERSNQLGVRTNNQKFSPFRVEQKYVGFIWNGEEKTVRLPDEKLEKRIGQIEEFLLAGAKFKYDQAEVLAGRLNHVTYIVPRLRCYLNSIYRWLSEWVDRFTTRAIPQDVEEDLVTWRETLISFEPMRLIANGDPTDIGWVGNASTGYGIGVLIGRKWAQFCLRSVDRLAVDLDEEQEEEQISRLETIAIRLGLLMLLQIGVTNSKTFIVWTDNTTTEGAVQKRKSKDRFVNEEWKVIQSILIQEQINLVAKRVTSKNNRADPLSRGDRTGHEDHCQILIDVPNDLTGLIYQET
ncbi:hypothetical protein PSTG_12026 [Puccinia striiformis f. sp. tritici PST-78]|uniref:Reverse transcriptase domain-containing protein n=1 Tax=Puccinia striiformis f. sp. tritici PST-78 TaxID=1165861 RepID=A0A0L0V6P2_9BASI|nr:hypothetical protein PSTG_12026 [Puccinia striiformis f. sp. tritici PST-78]